MFLTAVEAGSFSAAARKLGKAQSAVSTGIASLELDMGLTLFDRSTRKPGLTDDGRRVLEHARSVLLQMDELEAAATSVRRGEEALLRIALDDSLLVPGFGAVCARFTRRFPKTELEISVQPCVDVARTLLEGRADLGLSYSTLEMDFRLDLCFIGNLPFFAVAATGHPLAALDIVSDGDIRNARQLLLRGAEQRIFEHFPQFSAEVLWSGSFNALREMALAGLGWTYLPVHMAEDLIADGRLARLNVAFDHKPWSAPAELSLPKNAVPGPALLWLHEGLKQIL
jgi:DNA-binding transcriptional LysR family regulator